MDKTLCTELIYNKYKESDDSNGSLIRLHIAIRQLILAGALTQDCILPPTRVLASELRIGRSTVVRAYEQLRLEGYLQSRAGSKTVVADQLPVAVLPGRRDERTRQRHGTAMSRRGARVIAEAQRLPTTLTAFAPGTADAELFPFHVWRRLLARQVKQEHRHLAECGQGAYEPLQVAVAEYLRASRMMSCSPHQVLIVNGTHQAFDICARMLCDAGDIAWMEEPGYWGARAVMAGNGLDVQPVAVDAEGMCIPPVKTERIPRLVVVSPSSQFPTGVLMSDTRRRMLLKLAERHNAWIIEDDYDNEIRYHDRPVRSLYGQSRVQRVIYVGSLSKVMFSGLRLAYMVVPTQLVEPFSVAIAQLYRSGRLFEQAALADFIGGGFLSRHLIRVRKVYARRRQILQHIIETRLGNLVSSNHGMAGLHVAYAFNQPLDDVALARDALKLGVVMRPLSAYYADQRNRLTGMVLGFGATDERKIRVAAELLCDVIDRHRRRQRAS